MEQLFGVNLPRWGLKRLHKNRKQSKKSVCKFTPLGFETNSKGLALTLWPKCKFTPLGFETGEYVQRTGKGESVNLPRWGLKLL